VAGHAAPFKRGCEAMRLERSVEKSQRYRLFVQWDMVENHTVDFRGSADFQEWRSCSATASLRRRTSSTWLGGEGVSGTASPKIRANPLRLFSPQPRNPAGC
jgi:hypothetical protein